MLSDTMSSQNSLRDRHSDVTRDLILTTAVGLLGESGVTELTVRAVARAAAISERTIFRYFSGRDEFLDAVADATGKLLNVPTPPSSLEEICVFPEQLYRSFEENAELTRAVLHTDIYHRVRRSSGEARWKVVSGLIEKNARSRSKEEKKIAATNINYFLSATTWHYYRTHFGLTSEETIACAKAAIRQTLDDICGTETGA